jgi:hypothetical protein
LAVKKKRKAGRRAIGRTTTRIVKTKKKSNEPRAPVAPLVVIFS